MAPQKVLDEKMKYFAENDIVNNWFKKTLKKSEDNADDLLKTHLYIKDDLFRSFISTNTGAYTSQARFLKELAILVGERDKNNKKTSTGVFKNKNEWILQATRV